MDSLVAELALSGEILAADLSSLAPGCMLGFNDVRDVLRSRCRSSQHETLGELFVALTLNGLGWPEDDGVGPGTVKVPAFLLARFLKKRLAFVRGDSSGPLPLGLLVGAAPLDNSVFVQPAAAACATVKLTAPLTQEAVVDGFSEQFVGSAAEALAVAPTRIHIIRAEIGSAAVDFVVGPGPETEMGPEDALLELCEQLLDPDSPWRTGKLAKHVVDATIQRHTAGQLTSIEPPVLGEHVGLPRLPMPHGTQQLLQHLQQQLKASKIDASRAVSILDPVAARVSRRRPDLWRPLQGLSAEQLAKLGEADRYGGALAIKAWKQLMLVSSSLNEAAAALWIVAWPATVAWPAAVSAAGPEPKVMLMPLRVAIAAVRAVATAELGGGSSSQKPAQPTPQKPAQATPQLPAQPTAQKPAQPTAQLPAQVTVQQPPQLPAQQTVQLPGQPTAQKPAQPTAQLPAQVTAQQPTQVPAPRPATLPALPKQVPMELLQLRLFEVVCEAEAEPERTFRLLDRDGLGRVNAKDFEKLLGELRLPQGSATTVPPPLPAAVATPAASSSIETIDAAEFTRRYRSWLQGKGGLPPQPKQGLPPQPKEGLPLQLQPPALPTATSLLRSLLQQPESPASPAAAELLRSALLSRFGPRPIDLPSFVLFAFLGGGEPSVRVLSSAVRRFFERCLFLQGEAATRATAMCDVAACGFVKYRDFRSYMAHNDQERRTRQTQQEVEQVSELRKDTRAVLELVDQTGEEQAHAESALDEKLKRRGRHLDLQTDVEGLVALLDDVRLPSRAAAPLLDLAVAAAEVLQRDEKGTEGEAAAAALRPAGRPSYRELLKVLRRAKELLRQHVDGVYSLCMSANVDLTIALDFALRRPDQSLRVEELRDALQACGVNMSSADLEGVRWALDPYGCEAVYAPELLTGFSSFMKRYASTVSKLAGCLRSRGLTPDAFFSHAAACVSTC